MTELRIPNPRPTWLLGVLAVWTAPTTLLGVLLARCLGCGAGKRIGGSASRAYLYRLPPGRARGIGAVALGHAILVEPSFLEGREAWVLAHELSHTRQHDWLGPSYLLVHATLILSSVLLSVFRPVAGFTPQHAYNPLERWWLAVPFDALVAPALPAGPRAARVLDAFGLRPPS